MAFKMNRPIIKGTSHHKASIAKAKTKSIVAQTRTKADAGLLEASKYLGKSYVPQAIDYTIDQEEIKIPKKKEKKKKTKPKSGYEDYLEDINATVEDVGEEKGVLSEKDWKQLNKQETKKEKKVEVEKKKKIKVKKEKGDNIFEKGYKSVKDFIKEKRERKLNERLARAEQGEGEEDFSQIEAEPSRKRKKQEPYVSPSAGTEHGEELLRTREVSRNKALQEAAEKYNVKVEDLEAKEVSGKREFFPKQDVVGGKEETQWDDELGRFRKPEATIPVGKEEQKKAVQEMKPKYPKGMDPNLATTGEIALNYDTNTYEYTQQYYDKLAKEKIQQKQELTEPTDGEGKTLSKREIREKRMADKKYNNPKTSQYIKDQMLKEGYVPNESKSSMQMRDDRIYRHAIKNGTVQKNMIKGGYIPPNER